MILAPTLVLAACSQTAPGTGGASAKRPARIDAASLVRAYAQDIDEADVEFGSGPLVITGDVAKADYKGTRLLLTTGRSSERLPVLVIDSPRPIAAADLVTLRCGHVGVVADKPVASACTVTAIVPAAIAQGFDRP